MSFDTRLVVIINAGVVTFVGTSQNVDVRHDLVPQIMKAIARSPFASRVRSLRAFDSLLNSWIFKANFHTTLTARSNGLP